MVDVLEKNLTFKDTIAYYNSAAEVCFRAARVIVGQFGVGSDGHTAGLMPHSPALDDSDQWAVGYEWPDYRRLSLTKYALSKVNYAIAVAFGADKRAPLADLQAGSKSLADLPARILETLPAAVIYNDQIGEKA